MKFARRKLFLPSLVLAALVGAASRAAGLPDLSFGSPRLGFPVVGGIVVLQVPIRNTGAGEAGQCTALVGRRASADDFWIWEQILLDPLPAGAGTSIRLAFPLAAESGGRGVHLRLDALGELTESDEGNNELLVPALADLLPAPALDPPPAAVAGESLRLEGLTCPGWEVECLPAGEAPAVRGRADDNGRFALRVALAPGLNRFVLRALAGGVLPGPAIPAPVVVRDDEPPSLAILEPVEGGYYRSVRPRCLIRDQTTASLELILDGRPWRDGETIEGPGRHVLRATARDAAGNLASTVRAFVIDREPPAIVLQGVENGTTLAAGAAKPRMAAKDTSLRWAAFWVDGYLWRDGLEIPAGRHRLRAAAEDKAGNRSVLELAFAVEDQAVDPAPPGAAEIAGLLPSGAKPLLVKAGRLSPAPRQTAAVFMADRQGAVRLALAASGPLWLAPGDFGSMNPRAVSALDLALMDLDADGVTEIVAQGPGASGRRLLILRWQAGTWCPVLDLQAREILILAGPEGIGRPLVAAVDEEGAGAWQRTSLPAGLEPQFRAVEMKISRENLGSLAQDPGYAFLRPLRPTKQPAAPQAVNQPRYSVECGDGTGFALIARDAGYLPASIQDGRIGLLAAAPYPGTIGPSWLYPDPDGLFACDFDGDGVLEPYFTLRQGLEWRELVVFDRGETGYREVFRGRVRLPPGAYQPGLRFLLQDGNALIVLGSGVESAVYVWDRAAGAFVPAGIRPDDQSPRHDLLGRDLMVKADLVPDLW